MAEKQSSTPNQSIDITRNLGMRLVTAAKEHGPVVLAGTGAVLAAGTLSGSTPDQAPQPATTLTAGKTVVEVTSATNPTQARLESMTSAARATVAKKSIAQKAAKSEKMGNVLGPEHQIIQKSELKVIAWEAQRQSDGLFHGYEGTGFVMRDPGTGEYRIETAAHLFKDMDGNAAGLGITAGQPTDLAKLPNFRNFRIVVTNPLNQEDEWGTADGISVADQDTALLKLDPNSISTAMKNSVVPLDPSQQVFNPAAGIPVAMYAQNQITNTAVDGEGVTLGPAKLPWENYRTVYIVGINPQSVKYDDCYFRASGETAVLAGGGSGKYTFLPNESRRVTINPQAGDAPASTGQYQYNTIAAQLPNGTMGNSTLCIMEPGTPYDKLNSVWNTSTSTSTTPTPAPAPTPTPPTPQPTLPGHGPSTN